MLGKGIDKVLFALILVQWAYFARAARGAALVERNKEYVEAATCLALPPGRIVFRHMLPNCMPSLIVIATITLARAIALEATLSFLGVGVPVTQPSLGMLISNGFEFLLSGAYWISFFPGVALAIAIVGINLAGDHLRDVLNPQKPQMIAMSADSRSATCARTSSPRKASPAPSTASTSTWRRARSWGWWANRARARPSPAFPSWA